MDNRKRSKHLTNAMIAKLEPYAEEMYDLYWNWGLNFAEISKTLNVASPASVYRYFAYRFGAKTRKQQLQELKEKNTGRIWTEETKENVRQGVQAFYDNNKNNFLNDDGTPKENCPFKAIMNNGKDRQRSLDNLFETCYGNPKLFLQVEYVDKNKSIKDISNETGFGKGYIKTLLVRNGFKIKNKGETARHKSHIISEQAKENMRKAAQRPEVKKRRSEAQKKVWSKIPYEERVKRTQNGCLAGFNAVNSMCGISSIEKKVKEQLDDLGIKYIQQKQISDENRVYYLDFYIPSLKLVIECNGDYWHSLPHRIQRDKDLKEFVESSGHKIIFIWEHEINDEWFWIGDYI